MRILLFILMFGIASFTEIHGGEIHDAVNDGNVTKVSDLLRSSAPLLESRDDVEGMTPLLVAVRAGKIDVVRLLIQQGADVGARNRKGDLDPLSYSVIGKQKEIISMLLKAGANPGKKDPIYGFTPITYAERAGNSEIIAMLKIAENERLASATRARIVYVGGDHTVGLAIYKRDLTDPKSEGIRLTHVTGSKTIPGGKVVEEQLPGIKDIASPRWSADGNYIAFIGLGPMRHGNQQSPGYDFRVRDLWVMNKDGQGLTPLIQFGQIGGISSIRWSPVRNIIAFHTRGMIGVVDINSGRIEMLPRGGMPKGRGVADDFCWSPNGKAIVARTTDGSNDERISIFNLDGSCTDITRGGEFILNPYWWPDNKITFRRGAAGYYELDSSFWIMDPDGDNQTRITKGRNIREIPVDGEQSKLNYVYPFWLSGDGRTFAFQCEAPELKNTRSSHVDPWIYTNHHAVCIESINRKNGSELAIYSLDNMNYDIRHVGEYPYDIYFESVGHQ